MEAGSGAEGSGGDEERGREQRQMDMLRELVRAEGRMEAAQLLGVNYKTLVRTEESGRMSRRMADAVERLLGVGEDGTSVRGRHRERIEVLEARAGDLEERLGVLAGEMGEAVDGIGRSVEEIREQVESMGREHRRALRELGEGRAREAALAEAGQRQAPSGPSLDESSALVVSHEPAEGDEEAYGDAWPMVAEWRLLRAGHPDVGRGLSWLEAEEKVLGLELALLEDHGLTLPPETQPLRGFGRAGQINWRRAALLDTRRAIARRRLLGRVLWIVSLGRRQC